MGLIRFSAKNFRIIAQAELELSPRLNVIIGANGAGKTSLLEAIYCLGRAQSFRTTQTATLIHQGRDSFLLRGLLEDAHGQRHQLGLQRDKKTVKVRLNGQPLRQLSELVGLFPLQVINPDSHQLLEGGPGRRRRYLDWGVFHVEPTFFGCWKRYSRALRQRNAALRARLVSAEIQSWDAELCESALEIDQQRRNYLTRLRPVLDAFVSELVDVPTMSWEYRPGWSPKTHYAEALAEGLERDRRQGFTRLGPHRGDLMPLVEGVPAQDRLSRGQQKQVVVAMTLAQAQVYQTLRERPTLFLIDDLPSELDQGHRERVLEQLHGLGAQIFLTAIEPDQLDTRLWQDQRRFHVEHGRIQEVI